MLPVNRVPFIGSSVILAFCDSVLTTIVLRTLCVQKQDYDSRCDFTSVPRQFNQTKSDHYMPALSPSFSRGAEPNQLQSALDPP